MDSAASAGPGQTNTRPVEALPERDYVTQGIPLSCCGSSSATMRGPEPLHQGASGPKGFVHGVELAVVSSQLFQAGGPALFQTVIVSQNALLSRKNRQGFRIVAQKQVFRAILAELHLHSPCAKRL